MRRRMLKNPLKRLNAETGLGAVSSHNDENFFHVLKCFSFVCSPKGEIYSESKPQKSWIILKIVVGGVKGKIAELREKFLLRYFL